MGVSLAVVMELVSGREVSPVGVVAVDIVDEEGSVSVGTTVSAEMFGIEPKNIQEYHICTEFIANEAYHLLMHHLPVVAISSDVISAVKSII